MADMFHMCSYAPKSITDAIYGNITGARFDELSNQWLVPCDYEIDMAFQIGSVCCFTVIEKKPHICDQRSDLPVTSSRCDSCDGRQQFDLRGYIHPKSTRASEPIVSPHLNPHPTFLTMSTVTG